MTKRPRRALALVLLAASVAGAAQERTPLERRPFELGPFVFSIDVARGLELELLVANIEGVRMLAFHPGGELFAGSKSGKVYRFAPPYTEPEVLVELADYPHSVAFHDGHLYVARTGSLVRARYRPGQAPLAASDFEIVATLPRGGHDSRTLGVGPDGRLYLSIGITGNCSDEHLGADYPARRRRGGIMVLDPGAPDARLEPFASGLRNPVGFDWHPVTGVLYASNNGPDHLGYEKPPEVFAKVAPGSFHGMPWFQWDDGRPVRDPCISTEPPRPASGVAAPAATFAARSSPMAVAFVPEGALTPAYAGAAVVALRGSWGTAPDGAMDGDPASRRPPKIVLVRFEGDRAVRVDTLLAGFQLPDGRRWGRPVGAAFGPDGALYFTSDGGLHALYRLRAAPTP